VDPTPDAPEGPTSNSTVHGVFAGGQGPWPYRWMCPSGRDANFNCLSKLFNNAENWTYPGYGNPTVKYCLSRKAENTCKVEFGYIAAVLVIVANAIKVVSFVGVFWVLKRHAGSKSSKDQLLITTGDAIASFLADPDPHTLGMSMIDKQHFEKGTWELRCFQIVPMTWITKNECSRFRAIGLRRFTIGNLLYVYSHFSGPVNANQITVP
jgi:hypothetical protein